MKMIGWWPSLRATVADKPRTNRALAWRHLLETVRRQMVAFVDDRGRIGDEVSDYALADETLNDADVNPPSRSTSASADSTDRFGRDIEERR